MEEQQNRRRVSKRRKRLGQDRGKIIERIVKQKERRQKREREMNLVEQKIAIR